MSEISEPIAIERENTAATAPLSNARILWSMAAVVAGGGVLSFIWIDARFALGFIFGGILAFLNYYWLKLALKNIFEKIAATGVKPPFLAAGYFLRYGALGAVLAAIYYTQMLSMVAVLLGLSAFAFAVVIEGLIRLFSSISKREEF